MIEIEFKRNEKLRINGWELSNLISKMNTYSYKTNLMDEIKKELLNGVNPEDIIILDNSFKMNYVYEVMDIIDLSSDKIVKIFFIGKPVGYIPSKYIFYINIMFEFIENMRQKYKKYGFVLSDTDKLVKSAYLQLKNKDIVNVIESIQQEMIQSTDTSNRRKAENDFVSIRNKIYKKIEEYNSISPEIEKRKKDMLENKKIGTMAKNLKYTFNRFDDLLNRLVRPIVFVIDKQSDSARVLCRGQVNKKKQDSNSFEYKKYEHINPDYLTLVFPNPILLGINNILVKEREELEKLLKQKSSKISSKKTKEEEISTLKNEIKDIESALKELDIKETKVLDSLKEYDENLLENEYIQNSIEKSKEKLNSNICKLVISNKFRIKDLSID